MDHTSALRLRCPICDEKLSAVERTWRCPQGHSYDIARQGYVNLVGSQTRVHGDTLPMLRARRRFLDAGYYAPLAEVVTQTVTEWLRGQAAALAPTARTLVDCGCGEGYYLSQLANLVADAPDLLADWRLYGFDIARDAVRMAAGRRYGAPGATLFVANMWERLPFADAGVGAALVIFAPRNPAELARVIAPGGLLLVVTPAPEHLAEARAALPWLLALEPEKDARLHAALTPAFTLASAQSCAFPLALDAAALADLAEMTPHRVSDNNSDDLRQATVRQVAEAAPGGRLPVTASFVVNAFMRANGLMTDAL